MVIVVAWLGITTGAIRAKAITGVTLSAHDGELEQD